MFKTAEFIRRKVKRMKHRMHLCERFVVWLKEAIIEGIKHTVHGLKDFGRDSKWLIKRKLKTEKYSLLSYGDERKAGKVKTDILKFIPFSLFLIVPGGEALLPAYLKLFPNSLPSQFISDSDRKKKMHDLHKIQQVAAEDLITTWPIYLKSLLENPDVTEEDKIAIKGLLDSLSGEESLPTNLLEFRFIFRKYGNFRNFKNPALLNIAKFMGQEPITGLNFLNSLLKMVRLRTLDPCGEWLQHYSRLFLLRQINLIFNRLRVEDQMLSAEDISKIHENILAKICLDRGIDLDKSKREQVEDLRLWLSISNLRNVPHSLLLISRVSDFTKDLIINDEDETMNEAMILVSAKISLTSVEDAIRQGEGAATNL